MRPNRGKYEYQLIYCRWRQFLQLCGFSLLGISWNELLLPLQRVEIQGLWNMPNCPGLLDIVAYFYLSKLSYWPLAQINAATQWWLSFIWSPNPTLHPLHFGDIRREKNGLQRTETTLTIWMTSALLFMPLLTATQQMAGVKRIARKYSFVCK